MICPICMDEIRVYYEDRHSTISIIFMNDSIVSEHIGAMQTFVLQEMYLVVVQNEDNVSIMQNQATLYDHRHPHIDKVCD